MKKIEVVLAESDPAQVVIIRSNINNNFQNIIQVVKDYSGLLEAVAQNKPQLVILGRLNVFNYFELGEKLHKLQDNLQIVLVFREAVISSYNKALRDSGIMVITTEDYEKLDQILSTLDIPIVLPQITGEIILTILDEIVATSSKYFGTLSLGNYLRKAHAQVLVESLFIQNWSADHFGEIGCHESILNRELTDEEVQVIRLWVHKFIDECERTKVDFRAILEESNISLTAKYFLRN
jgi:hypothetical protein